MLPFADNSLLFFSRLCLAIDPVAILSIFQVLNVDPLLYMLVFGESILNDAVAIVLTNVIVESKRQWDNVTTTKLTAYSMIGLLATSNLTTLPSVTSSLGHRNYNGLARQNGQASQCEPQLDFAGRIRPADDDLSPANDNDDEESNEPAPSNDYNDEKNPLSTKKRRRGTHQRP